MSLLLFEYYEDLLTDSELGRDLSARGVNDSWLPRPEENWRNSNV